MKPTLRDALARGLLSWLVTVALYMGWGAAVQMEGRWWLAAGALLLWCSLLTLAEGGGWFWLTPLLWIAAWGGFFLLREPEPLGAAGRLLGCSALPLALLPLLRYYPVRAGLSLGWLGLWIGAAVREWPLPRLVPVALLPLLLLTAAETVRRFRREPELGATLERALVLSFLPAALVLCLLPAPAEPYGYPLLHAAAETVEQLWHEAETLLRYRREGEQEFGLRFNGQTQEAVLAGEREEGGHLYAYPEAQPAAPVYLFGNGWNRFDGERWSSTLTSEEGELLNWRLDTAEPLYALWRLGGAGEFAAYFRPNSLYLRGQGLNVRTMFRAPLTARLFTDAGRFPYGDAPTGTLFRYVQQEEVWYRIYYLESNPRLQGSLIAAAEGLSYDPNAREPIWNRVIEDYPESLRLDLWIGTSMEKTFAERESLIRRVYLDDSALSPQARALAATITADCESDWERLAAIAAYLRENYRYTLSPTPAPAGENWLDWLLFESREGYCTWYATAAALLARSVGVPTRYVQGYLGELAGEAYTALETGNAHAWCEGYIGGYGWVTVEATPGFAAEATGWDSPLPAASTPLAPSTEPPTAETETPLPLPNVRGEGEGEGQPVTTPEPAPRGWGWWGAAIPALLLAAVGLWLWLRARRQRRYAQADAAMQLRLDLERLLRDLRGKGYPRQPEETLGQYFARLPWSLLPAESTEAAAMASLYDRTFFGDHSPTEAELQQHRAFAEKFRPQTLGQWATWWRLR